MHATLISALAFFAGSALACQPCADFKMSFYGWGDNDPPGSEVAYNCGARNGHAAGDGSYANPLTAAVAKGIFAQCEIVYSPTLKKYLRIEDDCATCSGDWIDIWTGSTTQGGGSALSKCESSLTGTFTSRHTLIQSPPDNLEVSTAELFQGGTCFPNNVFTANAANSDCTGVSGTTTPPAVSSAAYIAPSSTPTGKGKKRKGHRSHRRRHHG